MAVCCALLHADGVSNGGDPPRSHAFLLQAFQVEDGLGPTVEETCDSQVTFQDGTVFSVVCGTDYRNLRTDCAWSRVSVRSSAEILRIVDSSSGIETLCSAWTDGTSIRAMAIFKCSNAFSDELAREQMVLGGLCIACVSPAFRLVLPLMKSMLQNVPQEKSTTFGVRTRALLLITTNYHSHHISPPGSAPLPPVHSLLFVHCSALVFAEGMIETASSGH